MSKQIGLREALAGLRSELSESIKDSENEAIRFEVKDISVEFELALERNIGGGAGLKVWVVSVTGEGRASDRTTHRIKLNLHPQTADGSPVLTGAINVPTS